LVHSFGAADACPDEADGSRGGEGLVAGSLMDLGDDGEAASQGGRFEGIGESCQVEGNGFGPGGQRDEAIGLAPAGKVVPSEA